MDFQTISCLTPDLLTCDKRCVTHDMWHKTHNLWYITHKGWWTWSQNFRAFFSKGLGNTEFWRRFRKPSVSQLLSDEGVSRLWPSTSWPSPPHKVSPKSTDPVPLFNMYSKAQNVNKVFLDCFWTVQKHFVYILKLAVPTVQKNWMTRELPYAPPPPSAHQYGLCGKMAPS